MHFLKVLLILHITFVTPLERLQTAVTVQERHAEAIWTGFAGSCLQQTVCRVQFYNRGSFKSSYQCSYSSVCPQQNPAPEYSDKPSMWRQTPSIPQLPSPVTGKVDLPSPIIKKNSVFSEGLKSAPIFSQDQVRGFKH